MNNARRKEIQKAFDLLDQAHAILQAAAEEEQEYYDNMPESIQSSEKGDKAMEDADGLQQAADDVETAKDACENILNG